MLNTLTRRGVAHTAVATGLMATVPDMARAQAQAAPYRWRSVVVGGGGFVPGIVFSRAERNLAYLRSDMGGAYRWDHALSRWVPLQDANQVSSYMGVESIAPDPVDADVVYAAVGMNRGAEAAILRSADRGDTWTTMPVDFAMGGNEDGRGLGERLAVDPNDNRILYFGSRHDGLQRSQDKGRTWRKVADFPWPGLGMRRDQPTHAGLAFVVFDPATGQAGSPTRSLFVGIADPDGQGVYRSDDAGRTWREIAGAPQGLSPVKAEIDDRGVLFTTWCRGMGPNGVTGGAVMRLDTRSHAALVDVSPPRPDNDRGGGFMGVAVDRQNPGTVLVSSMNRWNPGDTLWRSTDDGRRWTSLREKSHRDVSATPFLYWGNPEPDFGWWIAALALDPFDGRRAVYATGATIYATQDVSVSNADGGTLWKPWVEGIEQTAVITLTSPAVGPPLLSGFGDISGFAHEDLDVSPVRQFTTPVFANTNQIDWAGAAPNIIVRSGTPHEGVASEGHDGSTLAWSEDAGLSWKPLGRPRPASGGDAPAPDHPRMDLYRDAPITVSADGSTFVLMTPQVMVSRDRGASWRPVTGLPPRLRPVADRRDPLLFYALDFTTGRWFVSVNGAESFAPVATRGLPIVSGDRPTWRETAFPLKATPGFDGDLWLVSSAGLYNSRDGGQRFARIDGDLAVEAMDFGKAPEGSSYPTLFAIGRRGDVRGVFRSDDRGQSWVRVNDDRHEYGRRFRAIAGDPRIAGRVYLATDGRGIVYGDPA
ncbi:sialidase family protein [Brevundimonas sp.]|uniref:WD40/YVTN/BNR-like repeat-containing protein n=1 Tax=Brevundimonas sp. TaxID=1871086 RepID=UPI002ABCE820|nr:sialidase family protein [Brevundimonas sp.]MDZ4364873.1 sialidase family protein [Brevundimonas sp.]